MPSSLSRQDRKGHPMIHGKMHPIVKNFRLHPFNPATESHMLFIAWYCVSICQALLSLCSPHILHTSKHILYYLFSSFSLFLLKSSTLFPHLSLLLILALPFKVLDTLSPFNFVPSIEPTELLCCLFGSAILISLSVPHLCLSVSFLPFAPTV